MFTDNQLNFPLELHVASEKKTRLAGRLFFALAGFVMGLVSLPVHADDYVSVASGNWSSLSTWHVNGRTPANLPGSNDDIFIESGHIILVDRTTTCESIILSSGPSCKVIVPRDVDLWVKEDVLVRNASDADSVKNNIIDIQGKLTVGGDLIIGGGTSNQAASVIVNGTFNNDVFYAGKLIVKGTIGYINLQSNLYINDGSLLGIGGNLNVGTFLNLNTTVSPYSTVYFNGTTPQIIPANFTYGNITISNPAEARLSGPVLPNTIKGTLLVKGGGVFNNGGFSIAGNNNLFQVADSGRFVLSGNSAFPSGFSFGLSPLGAVEYSGANQVIAGQDYGKLVLASAGAPIAMGGNVAIKTNLDLGNNSLTLETYNLTIGKDGTISNVSPANYIKQTGSGKLIREGIGAGGITGEVIFPVGTATDYTPAYISNTGAANSFSVLVTNNVKDNANNNIAANVVNKTWQIVQETANGPANATLRLQWNATDEAPAFDRNNTGISQFRNGSWQGITAFSAANGSNPYSIPLKGLSSFSTFAVGDINSPLAATSPLPVELVYFKAVKQGESALLEWETATEKNNQGFEVQLSSDGKTFESIGFVESRNPNSQTSQRYNFTDPQRSKTGLWYYRIKQTDLDETVSFYGPKVIDFGKLREFVTVFPNPFTKEFQLNLQTAKEAEATISLHDLAGKMVFETAKKLCQGNNQLQIKVGDEYPAGLYLLTVKTGTQVNTARLIKL